MSLVLSFLEFSASFLSSFGKIRERWAVSPAFILLSSIFLSFLLALTNLFFVQIPAVLLSFILAYKVRVIKYILTVFSASSMFVLIPSVPYIALVITGMKEVDVLFPFFNLYLRSVSSSLIMTLGMEYLDWYGLVKGLNGLRVPRHIIYMFILFILITPELIRYIARLLSGRESRIVTENRGLLFRLLATSILDLLLYSSRKTWWLEKAARARTFIR